MNKLISPLNNENGSVIVVAVILLVLLTLIGIAGTNTSTTEVQIATNNQNYQVEFYLADSGWRQAGAWLMNRSDPPRWISADAESELVTGTIEDGIVTQPVNATLSQYAIPFTYQVEFEKAQTVAEGNGGNSARIYYEITSWVDNSQRITVVLSKPYQTLGYNN
jgi:hypothetical protein